MNKIINFKELQYVKPDFEEAKKSFTNFTKKSEAARNFEELKATIEEFETFSSDLETNSTIAMIRAYLDSSDQYYNEEMGYCMQNFAELDLNQFYSSLLNSPFAKELDKEYGEEFLAKLRDNIAIKSNGLDLMAKEQGLIHKYQTLKATIRIQYNNESLSEGQMTKYLISKERDVRRDASIALHKAFLDKKEQFQEILSELVNVRNEIAKVNGFSSFADYMNIEKGRRGYGQKELQVFCENIKEELTDFCGMLGEQQAKRLGLEKLYSYDCSISFKDGNAVPVGDGEILGENSKEMYNSLSKDISEMYNIMIDGNYLDVSSSPNKIAGMGFCTELFNIKFPYVFGNCTGTIHDASTFTHEVGHAYQIYMSLKNQPKFYVGMPNDIAEIPSKTMEHFTHDYAHLFFGEHADKFRFEHLEQSLKELLHYCTIHQYESWLYSNPEATWEERSHKYAEDMRAMDPKVDYSAIEEFMNSGSSLIRNMGVYMFPFYLISYALSAMSAMEFAKRFSEDKESAWKDYTKLCSAGGSLPYTELLKTANLHSPFEKSTIENSTRFIKDKIEKYIDKI